MNTLHCYFCGSSHRNLIGGPVVFICQRCRDLVENDRHPLFARIQALRKISAVLATYPECGPPAPPQKAHKRSGLYGRRR